jgi:spore coat protein A
MVSRRQFLAVGSLGGVALLLPPGAWAASTRSVQPVLNPADIPKYVEQLVIPPAMPTVPPREKHRIDEYRIGVRQFQQQILPPNLPRTTVWSYGSSAHPETFNYPSFTINARVDHPVRVTWINQLVDRQGRFLPHLLPVDPTLHWANPPGGVDGRDSTPTFSTTPGPYTGPVPIVTHLHGGHTREESDGYPEAWYLPAARDIPAAFASVGSFYDEFRGKFAARYGIKWEPGTATFQYDNDQRATTEWFHDHTLGITRANVYAGPAGFYLLRGGSSDLPPGVLPGPAPALHDRPGTRYYEIPIVVQDRSFNADGSLFYPASRAFFGDYNGPYIPATEVPPIWNPEFFAKTLVTNGRTWPVLNVEKRRYRLRFLNGCNSRFLILKIAANPTARPAAAALPIWQIGNDGGFLPKPVRLEQVLLGPANRADVLVDFTDVPEGTELFLVNEGPDGPYPGGTPGTDFPPSDPNTTGQVIKFVVGPRVGADRSVPPDQLRLPRIAPLGQVTNTRRLSLSERMSQDVPVATLLGTVDAAGTAVPLRWHDPITETPQVGATEIWELRNTTADAHPIHVHEVQFEVVGRGADGNQPPTPSEGGFVDTVTALPNEITRIKLEFDRPGRFVWHCHILEHEDNEMMRPYQIGPRGGIETGDGGMAGAPK